MSLFALDLFRIGAWTLILLALVYLARVNHLLKSVPSEVRRLSSSRWTPEQLKRVYHELQAQPIDYGSKLPPKLDRRYIVTGGNGEKP